jgi:hypothetical protein
MPAAPARPPLPDTVRYAFYLMLAGAALSAIGLLAGLAQSGQIRDGLAESMRETDPAVTQETIDAAVAVTMGGVVFLGLVGIGLWIWMAFANKAGKNWARITSTVFFGIAAFFTVLGLLLSASGAGASMGSSETGLGTAINILSLLVGLATVVLLWNGRSTPYFKPAAGYGYQQQPQPPGQAPDYPYPPSGPAPGQTAPPPGGDPGDMPPPR